MTITAAQQLELQQAATRTAYFAEFQFNSGTIRLCSFSQTITWGGYDWLGLGALGGISAIEETDGIESKALTFTLNAAQLSWLTLAIGPVEDYRGRPAKLYMCPLNESFQLIDTPVLCWRGLMDMMSFGISGEEGNITLKCETSAYGLRRQPALRINSAQQKENYPTDTGFDYLDDLISRPQLWISKNFQRI